MLQDVYLAAVIERRHSWAASGKVAGGQRLDRVAQLLHSHVGPGHGCALSLARRKLSVPGMNDDQLVPRGNRKIVHRTGVKVAKRQSGHRLSYFENLGRSLERPQRRLIHLHLRAARVSDANDQVGKSVAAVDFAGNHSRKVAAKRNLLRRAERSMPIALEQV